MSTPQNYGDVALNLPPDWSRNRISGDPNYHLTTIGHENGVADVYLTDDPNKRHQFTWVDPRDVSRVSTMRSKHYTFVNRSAWTKNEYLWEWDGEGYLVFNGQRLMFRDEEYFIADQKALDQATAQRSDRRAPTADSEEEERVLGILRKRGVIIDDGAGRELRPLQPNASRPEKRTRAPRSRSSR